MPHVNHCCVLEVRLLRRYTQDVIVYIYMILCDIDTEYLILKQKQVKDLSISGSHTVFWSELCLKWCWFTSDEAHQMVRCDNLCQGAWGT